MDVIYLILNRFFIFFLFNIDSVSKYSISISGKRRTFNFYIFFIIIEYLIFIAEQRIFNVHAIIGHVILLFMCNKEYDGIF